MVSSYIQCVAISINEYKGFLFEPLDDTWIILLIYSRTCSYSLILQVILSPDADPPVVKIMDYKYDIFPPEEELHFHLFPHLFFTISK